MEECRRLACWMFPLHLIARSNSCPWFTFLLLQWLCSRITKQCSMDNKLAWHRNSFWATVFTFPVRPKGKGFKRNEIHGTGLRMSSAKMESDLACCQVGCSYCGGRWNAGVDKIEAGKWSTKAMDWSCKARVKGLYRSRKKLAKASWRWPYFQLR